MANKHIKHTEHQVNREMQIKTKMRYHYKLTKRAKIKKD